MLECGYEYTNRVNDVKSVAMNILIECEGC